MSEEEKKARVFVYPRDGKWVAIEVVSQAYLAIEKSETLARDCAIARLDAVK